VLGLIEKLEREAKEREEEANKPEHKKVSECIVFETWFLS